MNSKRVIVIVLMLLLVIGLIVVSILFVQKNRENKEMTLLFELEKEEMENEYSGFASQYEELQIQINNDSLRVQLEREKQKTLRLWEELRQVKSTNAAEITRLKKELKTVRTVMRSYIVQIDSLNQLNEALTTENKKIKNQYRRAAQQISTLSEEKETLNKKVALAAQLDASNIRLELRNKRGRETDRLKRATRLAISFSIAKNPTAPTGERCIYARIMKPSGDLLTKGNETFAYEDKQLTYSIRKYLEYTGEAAEMTMYWDVEEFLGPGLYQVFLFSDGNMIGNEEFTLK